MVFAIPLADDHPDNALKDGYLSRSEPGTLSYDSIDGNLFEFATIRDAEKFKDIQIERNSIKKRILLFYESLSRRSDQLKNDFETFIQILQIA